MTKLSIGTRVWQGQTSYFVDRDKQGFLGDARQHNTPEGAREEARRLKARNPSWYELDL